MSNAERHEVTHDNRLLDLFQAASITAATLARAGRAVVEMSSACAEAGYKGKSTRHGYTYVRSDGSWVPVHEATTWVEKLAAGEATVRPSALGWDREAPNTLRKLEEAREAHQASMDAITRHEVNYTGWTRFYLVTSSAGHVHRSTSCSTCFPSTMFAPVPSLSGLDEAAAVPVLGESLCTVCFPSAPVKPSKITQAQALVLLEKGEAEFLAARAAKAAKDAAAGSDCEASGTYRYDRATARVGYMSGNAGTCECCGKRVTLTSGGKLRKHPAA